MPQKKNDIKLVRLKGKTEIDYLFENGSIYRTRSLLFRLKKDSSSYNLAAGTSVSKKNFKRAVDRNRIKRQLREALKGNEKVISVSGSCMLIYTGKKPMLTKSLIKEAEEIIKMIEA